LKPSKLDLVVRRERVEYRRKLAKVTGAVARVFRERYDVRWFRLPKRKARKLWVLAVWAERYHVPLEWVVHTLADYWRERTGKRSRRRRLAFGCSIPTFTGHFSEKVLREQVAHAYPNQENEDQERWERRIQLLGLNVHGLLRQPSTAELLHPKEFLRIYERRISKRGALLDKACSSQVLRRRRYRGSPWF